MTARNVYLSVDLDYWNLNKSSIRMLGFLQRVTRYCNSKIVESCELKIVESHEELLPHINASGCNHLINIDYHADFAGEKDGRPFPLGDGTWVDRVVWKQQGTYEWRAPDPQCQAFGAGYCHSWADPNPFTCRSATSWRHRHKRCGLKRISWTSVRAVGIALSPRYVSRNRVDMALKVLDSTFRSSNENFVQSVVS